jgi:hypothetical protein
VTALEPDFGSERAPIGTAFAPQLPEITLPASAAPPIPGQAPVSPFPALPPRPTDTTGLDTSAVLTGLPDARKAFVRKYQRLTPALGNLKPATKAQLVQLDLERVNRGQAPLNDRETIAAILAAERGEAITPGKEPQSLMDRVIDLPGAARENASTLLKVIPSIPRALVEEVRDLPNMGERITDARQDGANPIAAVLDAPGVRLLPGAYVAARLSEGGDGVNELLENPLFAALDVVPYAGKAAKATKVAKTATAERAMAGAGSRAAELYRATLAQQEALGVPRDVAQREAIRVAQRAEGAGPALRAVLTRRMADAPDAVSGSLLEPTVLGRATGRLGETNTGRLFREAWSPQAREVSGIKYEADSVLTDVYAGARAPEPGTLEDVARRARDARVERTAGEYAVPAERRVALAREAQEGKPGWFEGLDSVEQAYVRDADLLQSQLTEFYVREGVLVRVGDEVYDPATAKDMQSAVAGYQRRVDRFEDRVVPVWERARDEADRFATREADMLDQAFDAAVSVENAKLADAMESAARQLDEAKASLPEGMVTAQTVTPELRRALTEASLRLDELAVNPGQYQSLKFNDAGVLVSDRGLTPYTLRLLEDYANQFRQALIDEDYYLLLELVRDFRRSPDAALPTWGVLPARQAAEVTSTVRRELSVAQREAEAARRAGLTDVRAAERAAQRAAQAVETGPKVRRGIANKVLRDSADSLDELSALMRQAADPSSGVTWKAVQKELQRWNRRRSNPAAPARVGGKPGAAPVVSLGSWVKLNQEVAALAKAERRMLKAMDSTPPARFFPAIEEAARREITDRLVKGGIDPEDALRIIAEDDWAATGGVMTARQADNVLRDMKGTWREMKDAGYEPRFLHRTTSKADSTFDRPMVAGRERTPSAGKQRVLGSPVSFYQDLYVGLDNAAYELLQQKVTAKMLDTVEDSFAVPMAQLEQKFGAQAREAAESAGGIMDYPGRLEQIAKRNGWKPWDRSRFGGMSPNQAVSAEQLWVPAVVHRNLDRMFNPKSSGGFLNVLDKPTSLFRMSVLALSPRWHVYNIVGNTIMLMAEEGPMAFRPSALRQARALLKDARAGGDGLPARIKATLGSATKELADDAAAFTKGTDQAARWARLMENPAVRGGKTVIEKSYELNGYFDDMTRILAYLNGEKKAFGAGLTGDAAERAAMESVRRVSLLWSELTPLERGVLRKVFPFYSFTSKIMRMTMKYPFDHPVRIAVMGGITRAELEDLGTGLSSEWLNAIEVGGVSEDGTQRVFSMSGLNPFADVGDLFTMQGFIAGINPVGQTVLQQMGADTFGAGGQGRPRVVDRTSGRLIEGRPGVLPSLLSNTMPQIATVNRLLGNDAQFNELRRQNPDAADRMIAAGAGVPTSWRTRNETKERMTAELRMQQAQREAWTNALRTGNYSEAEKYPALQPQLQVLRRLRDLGYLSEYNPQGGAPVGAQGLTRALQGQVPWPT